MTVLSVMARLPCCCSCILQKALLQCVLLVKASIVFVLSLLNFPGGRMFQCCNTTVTSYAKYCCQPVLRCLYR